MAESINALIDIFAEDTTDRLAVDIQLVSRLQSLIPQFKTKARYTIYIISHFSNLYQIYHHINLNVIVS